MNFRKILLFLTLAKISSTAYGQEATDSHLSSVKTGVINVVGTELMTIQPDASFFIVPAPYKPDYVRPDGTVGPIAVWHTEVIAIREFVGFEPSNLGLISERSWPAIQILCGSEPVDTGVAMVAANRPDSATRLMYRVTSRHEVTNCPSVTIQKPVDSTTGYKFSTNSIKYFVFSYTTKE